MTTQGRGPAETSIHWRSVDVRIEKRKILQQIVLEIGGDDFVAIVGPNGAGKSTLLKGLAGLVRLAGPASLGFRPVNGLSARERALAFSYLPQDRSVAWPMPVRDVVALGRSGLLASSAHRSRLDAHRIAEAIALCGLEGLEDRRVTELSGGEKSRALLARALASDAPFLLADEPIASLDPSRQLNVMQALADRAKQGRPVVAVMHDIGLAARYCTRIMVLYRGRKVADDTAAKILAGPVLRRAFGVEFTVSETPHGPSLLMTPASNASA